MRLIVLMALTVDGKIGLDDSHFPDWTGKADKRMFKELTMRAGAIIMGSKTFDTIGKPLPGRKIVVMTKNPERYSHWDSVSFSRKPPKQLLEELASDGFQEVILAGGATINTLFAKAGLIDEMIVTYAPKIFGQGLSLFSESVSLQLELNELKLLEDGVVFVHYKILPGIDA